MARCETIIDVAIGVIQNLKPLSYEQKWIDAASFSPSD